MRPTPPRLLRLTLLPLALLPPLAGCPEQACTLLYAPDHVVVTLDADAFEAGEWQIVVGEQACSVTLPAGDAGVTCTGDAPSLHLTLDPSGAAITEATLTEAAPASVEVEISHDGVVVAREVLVPTYTELEPNGPGCGVTRAGEASLDIDG